MQLSCFQTKYQSDVERLSIFIQCRINSTWFKVDLEFICETKCTIHISQDKRFEEDHLRNYRSCGKTNDPWSSISAPLVPPLLTLLPDAAIAGRTCKRAQWSEAGTARQDRKDKSERLLLFVSTDNGAVMPGNIQTTAETFVRNGGIKSPWLVIPKGFNKARK